MRRPLALLSASAVGYAAGLFPSADVAARIAGTGDIRDQGTGNPGAANAIGVLGNLGYFVLAADISKGAIAGILGRRIAGDVGSHVGSTASVFGHCYPITNGFKGGKGVAASAGQALVTFPAYFVPDLALAGLTAVIPWWKQRAFTAVAVSSAAWTGAGVLWWRKGWPNLWGPTPTGALPIASAVTSAVIIERFLAAARNQQGAS